MKITIEIEDSKDYEQILEQLKLISDGWTRNVKEETTKKTYQGDNPYYFSPWHIPLTHPYKDERYLCKPLYYFGDDFYYKGPTCVSGWYPGIAKEIHDEWEKKYNECS